MNRFHPPPGRKGHGGVDVGSDIFVRRKKVSLHPTTGRRGDILDVRLFLVLLNIRLPVISKKPIADRLGVATQGIDQHLVSSQY